MSVAKEKYSAFIQENYVPLFFRDYYLNVVCDKPWEVILHEEENRISAIFVYMLKQKYGIRYIVQPQLCPYTGPFYFDRLHANDSYFEMIDRLPRHQLMILDHFYEVPPFKEKDNSVTLKHTYLINHATEIEKLWGQQSSTHRRIIRKADRELNHTEVDDIEEFLRFVLQSFEERGKKVPNEPQIFRKLDGVLKEKKQRKIVKCTNEQGRIVAMCYFMKDEKWTYNFANSVVEDYRHYGMNLILWNEIKATLNEGRSFDFEGSMIPGVDEFFRRFKGIKTYYPSIKKSSNGLVRLLAKIKTSKDTL
ncbi:MAG: GNAT family N-acetyltransferase [Bacteroidota bacterium]